jgi:hypothetical protein
MYYYTISDLKIEIMLQNHGRIDFEGANQLVEKIGEGWRLPTGEEASIIFPLKKLDCGNILDSFYWISDPDEFGNPRMAKIYRPDRLFIATRSRKDLYFVKLVRDI